MSARIRGADLLALKIQPRVLREWLDWQECVEIFDIARGRQGAWQLPEEDGTVSTHRIEIVEVRMEPHPNADSLSIVRVRGWTCVVRTEDWVDGALAAYIPPDYVVPERPEYEFLRDKDGRFHGRIRVRRFRGMISQGLLMPAPPGAAIGDDAMAEMGIERYVPPEPYAMGGDQEPPPETWAPTYDVENAQDFPGFFRPGEQVVVTEKLHGCSARFVWEEGRLRVGSRTTWKKYDPKNLLWQVAARNPWVEEFCRSHPEMVVYGEVFGWVQDLKYGAKRPQDVWFRVFDVLIGSAWDNYGGLAAWFSEDRRAPLVYAGPYSDALAASAVGPSLIPGAWHLREGVVIRPSVERSDFRLGRVQVKLVSDVYLERSGK